MIVSIETRLLLLIEEGEVVMTIVSRDTIITMNRRTEYDHLLLREDKKVVVIVFSILELYKG